MEPLSSSAKSNHRTGMGKCVSTSDRFLKKKKKNISLWLQTLQWPLLMQITLEKQLIRLEDHIFMPWHL